MKTIEEIQREIYQVQILKQSDKIPYILREWVEKILEEVEERTCSKVGANLIELTSTIQSIKKRL